MKTRSIALVFALASTLALAACGGGGGTPAAPVQPSRKINIFGGGTLADGVTGTPYSVRLTCSGSNHCMNHTATWTVSAGTLPPGLALETGGSIEGAAIWGTPMRIGTYAFTVRASAPDAQPDQVNVTIKVNAGPMKLNASGIERLAVIGQQFSLVTFWISGGSGDPKVEITSGTVPRGLTLHASGVLEGTPQAGSAGAYHFTYNVTDGDQSASGTLNQKVAEPLVVTSTLPDAALNAAYSSKIQVSGGSPPYSCWINVGSMPPGIFYNPSTCEIYGTSSLPGAYPMAIRVSDDGPLRGQTVNANVGLSVRGLLITPDALPRAAKAVPYYATLTALGDSGQTWSVVAGDLPPGLTLAASTGRITGTSAAVGAHPLTIRVTAGAESAQRDFTLLVGETLGRNDSRETATVLTADPRDINVNLSATLSPTIIDGEQAWVDVDYYKVMVRTGKMYDVWATPTNDMASPVVTVTDENGRELTSARANTPMSVRGFFILDGTGVGTVYISVRDWFWEARPDMQYTLTVRPRP